MLTPEHATFSIYEFHTPRQAAFSSEENSIHSTMAGSPFKLYHALDYWLFIIITLVLIIFSIGWEFCLEEMEHAASNRKYLTSLSQPE